MSRKSGFSLFGKNLIGGRRNRKSALTHKPFVRRRSALSFEQLEVRQMLDAAMFQEGLNSYVGAEDTVLFSQAVDSNFGSETAISVDQQDANGVRQGLLQFKDLFGDSSIGFTQIPFGSTINSATLLFEITNPSTSQSLISLYRMLQPWSESTATWNSFGSIGGVQTSEGEAADFPPDYTLFDPRITAVLGADESVSDPDRMPGDPGTFDVTRSLQSWSSGETVNNGWLLESGATDGWDFTTSEGSQGSRPFLRVDFTPPTANQDTIQFIDTKIVQAEGHTGTTAIQLTVARLGGQSGTDTVEFTVADGTAQDAGSPDDYDAPIANGMLTFNPGDITKTITINVNGDTVLEGNETLTVTLTNAVGAALGSNDVATVVIADDDALINEVLANVSDVPNNGVTGDETNREYVELIGTPGASLSGYYFVVFEGQEEEAGGGSGVADLVVDLSSATFGTNGLLVLRPTTWDYAKAADTNELVVPSLGTLNGLEDNSQTYALVRSTVAPVQGTDYDIVGSYVGAAQDAVDSPLGGVGLLDVGIFAPGGAAQIVDSVSVFNGGSDRDRAIVTEDLGLPGVHVHQPTRTLATGDNVASDAVSRLEGNFLPNSIGAWFNGDIIDSEADDFGSGVIEYLNGTTQISAVAPPGSVLTPGAPNTLNNVFVSAVQVSYEESGGAIAEFTVTRTGNLSQTINVSFTTVDGTAKAGVSPGTGDYDSNSGVLIFDGATMEFEKTIQVTINDDGIPEGFESFSVQLTSADLPYLITEDTASVRINDGNTLVAEFQQGVVGVQGGPAYSSTEDTYIDAEPTRVTTFFGVDPEIRVDDAEGGDFTGGGEGVNIRPQQGLISFDNLFGGDANQVPVGAQIFGATLTLNVTGQSDSGANINFFRMLKDWNEVATWNDPQGSLGNDIVNGITPDGIEASEIADFSVPMPEDGGLVEIPLNIETLQAWSNGSIPNYGWVAISDSGELWQFASSEGPSLTNRPKLTLQYTDPAGQAGLFAFAQQEAGSSAGKTHIGEGNTAEVIVQRIGGTDGAANVDYQITFGTADSSDIGTPTPSTTQTTGTLSFSAGEFFKTISIPTIEDTDPETNQTLTINLLPSAVNPGAIHSEADEVELTIRDDDSSIISPPVLVSEIIYNQPGNDGGSEMFELVGTPNAPLGSFYAIVIAGDSGEDQGATDLVVDLGAYTNGSNGTTLIGAASGFNWNIPAGTTFIGIPELNAEFLGGNDNGTSTYALVYSPTTPLHVGRFDYDVDNNGGGLDLPAGAVIVDSIAIRDTDATVFNDDTTYSGGGSNTFFQPFGSGDALDGVSRKPGNTTRNSASAWYAGDLIGSDDALVYDYRLNLDGFAESIALPASGAAASPGLPNTVASPIVVVTSVNNSGGNITIDFSGNVDQVLLGDGTSYTGDFGPGISVTDASGAAIPGIDAVPSVTGLGTSTLTLSFSGSSTSGGALPAGSYNINIVGNSIVADGRAVDANIAGATNSTSIFVNVGLDADFDDNLVVDGDDFLAWQRGFGKLVGVTNADGDADGDQDVDSADLAAWESQYGTIIPPLVASVADDESASQTLVAETEPVAAIEIVLEAAPAIAVATASSTRTTLPTNTWLKLPTFADGWGTAEYTAADDPAITPTVTVSANAASDAFFATNEADADDLYSSISADGNEESTVDDAFAEWDALALAI